MQITIPDDPKVHARAQAAGFSSVGDYVLQLVKKDVQQAESSRQDPDQQSAEEWVRDFRAIFETLPPSNPNFDDSRESIYPVR